MITSINFHLPSSLHQIGKKLIISISRKTAESANQRNLLRKTAKRRQSNLWSTQCTSLRTFIILKDWSLTLGVSATWLSWRGVTRLSAGCDMTTISHIKWSFYSWGPSLSPGSVGSWWWGPLWWRERRSPLIWMRLVFAAPCCIRSLFDCRIPAPWRSGTPRWYYQP